MFTLMIFYLSVMDGYSKREVLEIRKMLLGDFFY